MSFGVNHDWLVGSLWFLVGNSEWAGSDWVVGCGWLVVGGWLWVVDGGLWVVGGSWWNILSSGLTRTRAGAAAVTIRAGSGVV